MPADAATPSHRHDWGEFVYSFSGLMELRLDDGHYLAPPHHGIWLPPQAEHIGSNRHEASYCSLYVSAELCDNFPKSAAALQVSSLVRSILEHLRDLPAPLPQTEAQERLLRVLVDQLQTAPCVGSYLTGSDDPLLEPLLAHLERHPEDNQSNAALARWLNTTERTLARRCYQELGMSLGEWRQRLRVVRALSMLEEGKTVEDVALDLGYSSASAFIAMFRRLTGATPGRAR